jgi:hypothetical protein
VARRKIEIKVQEKGNGQECPFHTFSELRLHIDSQDGIEVAALLAKPAERGGVVLPSLTGLGSFFLWLTPDLRPFDSAQGRLGAIVCRPSGTGVGWSVLRASVDEALVHGHFRG